MLYFQPDDRAAEQYDRYSLTIMEPFVTLLAEHVLPGDRVLDLACGAGYMARAALARCLPGGSVAAVDVNEGMLRVARQRLPRTVSVARGAADDLPYGDDAFDAVLCQQGVQFFPGLEESLAEAHRVLQPGGLFAATAWVPRARLPYLEAQAVALQEIIRDGNSSPHSPAFSMTPSRFEDAAHAAGFVSTHVAEVRALIRIPDVAEYAVGHLAAMPFGAAAAATARPGALVQFGARVAQILAQYDDGTGAAIVPFTSLLLTARA